MMRLSLQKVGKNRERFLQNIGLYAVGGATRLLVLFFGHYQIVLAISTPEVSLPPVVLAGIAIMSYTVY